MAYVRITLVHQVGTYKTKSHDLNEKHPLFSHKQALPISGLNT